VFVRVLFLGLQLGLLCMLRGAPRFSCVLRGALRFFDIYNITYHKKKMVIYQRISLLRKHKPYLMVRTTNSFKSQNRYLQV
jgi:hypothetical protein